MTFTKDKNIIRWTIIAASFLVVSLILWNTYIFFQNFKAEERTKMHLWALAQKEVNKNIDLNTEMGELPIEILESNTSTPMILVNMNGTMAFNNIDENE